MREPSNRLALPSTSELLRLKVPTADATPIVGDAAITDEIVTAATTRSLGSLCSVIIGIAR